MRLMIFAALLIFTSFSLAQNLPTKPPVYYFNPSWSPDGKVILFESTKDGRFAIYTIHADGTGLKKLTDGAANDEQPRWSRDGRQIVFISDAGGHLQLYLMNADGKNRRQLTNQADIDYQPDLSPKGDWVAFISRPTRLSAVHDIYLIRADGTGRKALDDRTTNEGSPRWSPDGKQILFQRNQVVKENYRDMSKEDMAIYKNTREIFVMNANGTRLRQLTKNNIPDGSGVWSRNGKTIYFISEAEGTPKVYSMKPDGSDVKKVLDFSIFGDPTVSPNEKYFIYSKETDKKWAIYIYDRKKAQERKLIGD